VFAWIVNRPGVYALSKKVARLAQVFHRLVRGTRLDPAYAWTRTRDLPPIAKQTFKEYWRNRS
jgi:L-lactate dehydrogenase complex protein LldF